MAKLPSFQWYPGDWLKDPAVRSVSLSARGLWTDLLCLMWQAPRRGYLELNGRPATLEQIARMTGCSTDEASHLLQELETAGVYSLSEHGTIYSRRMVRDEEKRAACSEAGKRGGGNPALTFKGVSKGTPKGHPKGVPKASSSSSTSVKPPLPPKMGGGGFSIFDCAEFRTAWDKWTKHRSEIRKPIRETEMAEQLSQFTEWGVQRSVDAINYTIAKGWVGISEPDAKPNSRPKHKSAQDAINYLRRYKEPPCFLGGELHHKFCAVGFDGLTKHEQVIAVGKCKKAMENPR